MIPKVICHIMSSVDGRLLVGRWTTPFDGTDRMDLLKIYGAISQELHTDAWMFGKNTVKAMFPDKFETNGKASIFEMHKTFIGECKSKRMFIVTDPDGDIRFSSNTLRGDNIIVILGESVTEDYLLFLREMKISYIIVADGTDLHKVLCTIEKDFGIQSISLQGGGILNGSMLNNALLDELSLVIYPGIDGLGGIPSIFEYIGGKSDFPANGQSLELLSVEKREHGVVWLRYKFHKN